MNVRYLDDKMYWVFETKEDYQYIEEIKHEIAYNLWEQRDIFIDEEEEYIESFNYKKAYNILMDYWDSIPDEEKKDADKRLNRLGL